MPAYVIGEITITDPEKYEEYRGQVAAIIEQYGGKFVVRGAEPVMLEEGHAPFKRSVVIEFASVDDARRWYESAEYGPLIALRQAGSESAAYVVEGV